jgi:sec-independent protein translocase protein TatA
MDTLAFFQNMGVTELLIILFIVLLLFGSTKLPSLARSLGSSVNEFKKGAKEGSEAPVAPPQNTNATNAPAVPTEKK